MTTKSSSSWITGLAVALAACVSEPPRAATPPAHAPSLPAVAPPAPACDEIDGAGLWGRSTEPTRVEADRLAQAPRARLRFLGAHLFDLLDKLEHEVGPDDGERRRTICAALNAVAASGAPVVRIWGTLKRTGSRAEVERAASLLALVLDEDARRRRPLRFVVTLLNHQGGYGAPRPEVSLDDQDPASAWNARRLYLGDGWRARGEGQLLERIERLRADAALARSPYVLAWELVNELDTHRAVAGGALSGPTADALRDRFLVPALTELGASFSQPILLGDLRGAESAYVAFARSVIAALPASARARLAWTSHVYLAQDADAAAVARATRKLDLDLQIAAEHGLPFVLGELGQRGRGEARFCGDGPPHDAPALFAAVLDARPAVTAALFWGEGQCGLPVPGSARRLTIGAGGDTADLGPGDVAARAFVRSARRLPRFSAD